MAENFNDIFDGYETNLQKACALIEWQKQEIETLMCFVKSFGLAAKKLKEEKDALTIEIFEKVDDVLWKHKRNGRFNNDSIHHEITELKKKYVPGGEAARFIELPCKIGETVYCISTPCGGCPRFEEPMREEFIESCRKCTLAEIVEVSFDYDMIPEVGETVFFDRAAAEKALEAWNGKG